MTSSEEILEYWFGPEGSEPGARADLWWGMVEDVEAVDREIEERFGEAVEEALDGGFAEWREEPESCLAYVLLLDQFPRHIYRGRPGAFSGGELAVEAVRQAIEAGLDEQLDVPQRIFLYMPLMHAEERKLQRESVRLYERLAERAPEETREMAEGSLKHAREHAEIVEEFGRYPHRNAVLGRESSPAEEAFLEEMERDYGQSPR